MENDNTHKFKVTESLFVYFKGLCEPVNPGGSMGIGFIIYNDNKEPLFEYAECIHPKEQGFSFTSSTVADYYSLTLALRWITFNKLYNKNISIFGDSKMVIYQMTGLWKMNHGAYYKYACECKNIIDLKSISLTLISKQDNNHAFNICNNEITKAGVETKLHKQQ